MEFDAAIKPAVKLMGDRLKALRVTTGKSAQQLEDATGIDITTIYGMEAGKINWTIDKFARLLDQCGVSLHDFLIGLKEDQYTEEERELHRILQDILRSGLGGPIATVESNLRWVRAEVERLRNPNSNTRGPREGAVQATAGMESGDKRVRKRTG